MRDARRWRIDRFDLPRHAYNTKGNRGTVGAHARLEAPFPSPRRVAARRVFRGRDHLRARARVRDRAGRPLRARCRHRA
ncbi:hypothetical protein F01_420144 [Burkholderia cenocepacia]|nr:hypothetical protein F01_420144 [Burkholderia cenocepacia]